MWPLLYSVTLIPGNTYFNRYWLMSTFLEYIESVSQNMISDGQVFLIFTNSNYIYYEIKSFTSLQGRIQCFRRNFISADLMCTGKFHISAVFLLLIAFCGCSIRLDAQISIGHLDLDLNCGTRRFPVPLSSSLQ